MNKSKEEACLKKDLTDAIRESNETFASLWIRLVHQCLHQCTNLARSFEFKSQMILINKDTVHQTFQPVKTTLGYKVKVTMNKVRHYIIILTINLMNLDTLVVEIYQWIMKTMKVVQHTNNYSKNMIETRLKLLDLNILLLFNSFIKNPPKTRRISVLFKYFLWSLHY